MNGRYTNYGCQYDFENEEMKMGTEYVLVIASFHISNGAMGQRSPLFRTINGSNWPELRH